MTTGEIIDGRGLAAGLRAEIADGVVTFRSLASRAPGLAVVLVGDNPAGDRHHQNALDDEDQNEDDDR